jgi:hypothetical protein
VSCTTSELTAPEPKDVFRRRSGGDVEIVTVYSDFKRNGFVTLTSECPRGMKTNGGGADKFSGSAHFSLLDGSSFRRDGRVGWKQRAEVGPGPLVVHIEAFCQRA